MITLNKKEYQQYSRQLILDNIGIKGQRRLKAAKILVIGLGGLGCPIILYLATAGIGQIGLVEYDIVHLSNLNRQILYSFNNIGEPKITQASSFIQNINNECKVNKYNNRLTIKNIKQIVKQYDIVIDATDNFETRYLIDEICYQLHKTYIYGAINKYEGHISVFNYKNNTRFIDVYPRDLKLKDINCNDNGVLGSMSGLIGILQATEAIKLILGIGKLLNGVLLKYNLLNTSFQHINISPIKYSIKSNNSKNNNKTVNFFIKSTDIQKMKCDKYILIDIRNPLEFHSSHINQAINVPTYFFHTQKAINFLKDYAQYYDIILICNDITKSITIRKLLIQYKLKVNIIKD